MRKILTSTPTSTKRLDFLRGMGIGAFAIGTLAAGCAPVPPGPMNYAYEPPPMYGWGQPTPAVWREPAQNYGPPIAEGPPDEVVPSAPPQRGEAQPEAAPAPKPAASPPQSAGLEDTAGWWRGGGIFWPRWQEPIP